MAKRSRKSAFEHFGASPANVMWSRSARTADGKSLVVTLWQDQLKWKDGFLIYSHTPDKDWFESPGQRELRDNLIWCREKCGGRFKVVLVTAKNLSEVPREVASSDPVDRYEMILVSLVEETGAFEAKSVPLSKSR